MSRIVYTEGSLPFIRQLNKEKIKSFKKETLPNSPSLIKFSDEDEHLKIEDMLRQYNPIEEYNNKLENMILMTRDSEEIKKYLLPKFKSNSKDTPPKFLERKIQHITKMIASNNDSNMKKQISEKLKKTKEREKEGVGTSTEKALKKLRSSRFVSAKDIAASFSFDDPKKIFRKCNDMLFSENYLDRLFQRYKFYLKKNEEIKKKVQGRFEENFEKRNKIIESIDRCEPNNISQQIYEFGESKYFNRLKQRMEDYHRKKFVACWDKNKLPPINFERNANKKEY